MKKRILTALALAVAFPNIAGAALITVNNNSFEDNNVVGGNGGNNWANGIPDGWTSQGGVAGTADPLTVDPANTNYYLELSSAIGPATGGDGLNSLGMRTGGFIFQDLGVAYLPNTTYTVDILGDRRGAQVNTGWFGVADDTATLLGTVGTMDTSLFPESNVFFAASALTGGAGSVGTFTTGGVVPTGNVFVAIGSDDGNMVFDLITVDATAIPEPSSLAYIGLLLGLLTVRRRR